MKKRILLFMTIVAAIFFGSIAWATSITTTGSGNWSSTTPGAPWPGGIVPLTTDDVIIADGHTVTIDQNVTVASLTVGQGTSGILTFDGVAVRAVTVTGNVSVAAGGTFITQTVLNPTGDVALTTTVNNVSSVAGVVVGMSIYGTGIPSGATVTAVTPGTPNTITISAAGSAAGTGVLLAICNAFTNTLSIGGDLTNNGTFDMYRGIVAFTAKALCNVTFTKVGNQNVTGNGSTFQFWGITLNKGGLANKVICNANVSMALSAGLVLTSGTWDQQANTFTITQGNQTFSSATGSLTISGTGSFNDPGASLTISGGNITVNTSGTFLQGSGNNNTTISAGTLNFTSGTVTLNGKLVMTGGTTTINGANITINQQGTSNATAGNNAFDLQTGANLIFSSGTVTFGSPNAAISDAARTGRDLKLAVVSTTGDLAIGSTTISTVASTAQVVVGVPITGTGIPASTTVTAFTANTITLSAAATATGTTVALTLGRNLTGSTFIFGDGSITPVSGSAGYTISVNSPTAVDKLVLNGGGVTGRNYFLTASLAVNGTLTYKSGTTNLNGKTLTMGASSTFEYNGTSAQSTGTELPASVNNLTINNSAGVTLTTAATVNGILTLTTGAFNVGANTLTLSNPIGGTTANLSAGNTSSLSIAGSAIGVNIPNTITALNNLTLNNSNGTTLQGNLSVGGVLTFTAGKILTGINTLSVPGTILTAGAGKFVEGNLALPVSSASIKKWDVGQNTDYIPFSAGFNSITGSDNISVAALDRNTTAPLGQFSSNSKLLRRFFRVAKGNGISSFATDSLVLGYTNTDVSEQNVLDENILRVFKFDGSRWSEVTISRRDTAANTITVTGVTSFSDFVITGADMPGLPTFTSKNIVFGNSNAAFTKVDSSVTITNNGATDLTISAITSNNSKFTILPASAMITPAASRKFYISYTPTTAASDAGLLIFTSNGSTLADTVTVSGTGIVPTLSLSTLTKNYGNVLQGSGKTDSVSVTNTGAGILAIDTVVSDNADFTVTPNAKITILPTEAKKFYVTFTPSTVASKSGNIIFKYNDTGESPDTLVVNGIGSVPGFGLSTYLVDFGKVRKSTLKKDSVEVENSGGFALNITGVTSDAANFSVTPTTAAIASLAKQKFYITFAPTSVGLQTANIRFAHDGSKPADTVVAKGIGVMPIYQASIQSGDFGNVSLGKSKTDSMYIRNIGTDTLHLDSLHHFRSEFTWVMTGKRLYAIAPGDSNKSVVTFTPVSLGMVKDTFVTYNDGANLQDTTYAQGVGVQSKFAVAPLSIAFSNVNVSSTKKDSVVVTNSGLGILQIDSIKADNAMFTVSPATGLIAPAGTATFYVTFGPTSTGAKSANIFFYSNAPSVKDTVKVSGTGVQAAFALAPTTISFGGSMTGQTKKDSIVVTNTGTSTLIIDSVKSDNAMITISSSTGTTVAASASFKFYLNFTPTSAGLKTAKVVFYHKGPSKTDTLTASGTGFTGAFYTEDFTSAVGTALTSAGWTISGTSTVSPIVVTTPGLSIGKYNGSGVGNAATLTTTGQDVYNSFPSINSGTVYFSFMMNVASAGTGDYFVALSPVSSQTNYYARLHVKSSGAGYVLGISKSNEVSGGAQYGSTVLNFNTTALVVVKYTFTAADTANDPINVYAFTSTIPTTEPATAEIASYVAATKTDASDFAYITLRQGTTGAAPALVIDGLRVGATWALGVPTAVTDMFSGNPTVYELQNNYPNPFNPSTTILYGIPLQSTVTVKIYSILGQEVKTLVNDVQSPSYYRVIWNGTDNNGNHLSSGVYFIRITADANDSKNKPFIQVKKMLLMK